MPKKTRPDANEPDHEPAPPRRAAPAPAGGPPAGPEGGYAFPFARSSEEDEIREMYGWGV